MSGHSKWSKVKHQKAVTDSVKARLFTKAARAITIAVHEGGGVTDPDDNFKLRLAIENARGVNMPKENIDRAIAHAALGAKGGGLETILYEGFGPGGVGILIESATDNKQRTVSVVRNVLETAGGSLGSTGSVGYLFDVVGMVITNKGTISSDDMLAKALDAGAVDCIEEVDAFILFTTLPTLFSVKTALAEAGIMVEQADVVYRPKTTLMISPADKVNVDTLVMKLEELDDVQRVFTNV